MADEILCEAQLVADEDALNEMGAEAPIIDNFQGSRVLIVKRGETADAAQGVATVDLLCSFVPAPDTRVVWAEVRISLLQPQGAMFIDIAPREVKEPAQVEITREIGGKLTLKYGPLNAEPSAKQSSRTNYNTYVCRVKGAGAGSVIANWHFEEDGHARTGIGAEQALAISIPSARTVKGEVTVLARLARNGVAGPALDMIAALTNGARRAEVTLFTVR